MVNDEGKDDVETSPNAAINASASAEMSAISVDDLPPLPEPNINMMRRQSSGGLWLVLGIIVVLVGLTHGIALTIGFEKNTVAWWIVFGLIYGQAGLALMLLLAVLNVNPGTISRTDETCFPLPRQISHWLAASKNEALRPPEQYLPSETNERDTYCTRCLVWRRQPVDDREKPIRYFHCNICQRCVRHFDHHCNIFGRCIGGTPTGPGNLKFFYAIIAVGGTAYLTTLGSVLGGLIHSYDPKWVIPFFLVALVVLNCCSPMMQNIVGGAGQTCWRLCCQKQTRI